LVNYLGQAHFTSAVKKVSGTFEGRGMLRPYISSIAYWLLPIAFFT